MLKRVGGRVLCAATKPAWGPRRVVRSAFYATAANEQPPSELETLKRRVRWRLFERGMRENELIFRSFCHHNMEKLSKDQLLQLEKLADELDPDLYKWFTGSLETPEDVKAMEVWGMLVQHMKDISLKDEWSIRNRSAHTNPAFS